MKVIKQLPVFVYGSLKLGKHNHSLYLEGKVQGEVKKARIKAALYDLPYKGYPAIISNERNMSWVHGEVYNLIDFEETLITLDKLESYYGKGMSNNEYERECKIVEVWNTNNNEYEPLEVFVYFYCEMKDTQFFKSANRLTEGYWPKKEI